MARFNRLMEKVTIHCGKELVKEIGGREAVMNPVRYPVDQLLLMYVLARREGAIFHAAAVNVNGKGYIFPGRSGAGKSTAARNFALKGHEVLSDDRIIVRKINGEFRVFGTPWAGEAGMAENKDFPLGGICFVHQDSENMLREVTPAEAVEKLMPVTSIPRYDRLTTADILALCEDMAILASRHISSRLSRQLGPWTCSRFLCPPDGARSYQDPIAARINRTHFLDIYCPGDSIEVSTGVIYLSS